MFKFSLAVLAFSVSFLTSVGITAADVNEEVSKKFLSFAAELQALTKVYPVQYLFHVQLVRADTLYLSGFAWTARYTDEAEVVVKIRTAFLSLADDVMIQHTAIHEYCHIMLGHLTPEYRDVVIEDLAMVEREAEVCVRDIVGKKRYEEYRSAYQDWANDVTLPDDLKITTVSLIQTMAD